MKKVINLFITAVMFSFMAVMSLCAKETIKCPTTAEVGGTITCKITIDEETRMVESYDDFLKITSVNGTGNYQVNNFQAIFNASGEITFIAKAEGETTVDIESADGNLNIVSSDKIVITKKTTASTTKPKSDNNYLSEITIDGKKLEDFSKDTSKYYVDIENEIEKVTIKAKTEDDKASYDVDGPSKLNIGDNEYTITVTAEDKTTKVYKVVITRLDKEEEKTIEGIKGINIKGYKLDFNKSSKTFHLTINKKDTELDIDVILNNDKASYAIEGNEDLEDGSVIKIIVTEENGDKDTYRIVISKNETNGMLIAVIIIIIVIIIGISAFIFVKKSKNKNNKEDKTKKVINNEVEEKTKEIVANKTNKKPEEELENTMDEDLISVDNDEEEETRILSYVEREELARKNALKDDIDKAIDDELDKTIVFDYNNDDNSDEYDDEF